MKKFWLIVLSLAAVMFMSCSSDLNFYVWETENAATDTGILAAKSKGSVKYWTFNQAQKEALNSLFSLRNGTSIYLDVKTGSKKGSVPCEIGFLYAKDLESGSITAISSRPVVQFLPADFSGATITVGFALDKENEVPAGFFVKSESSSITVTQVQSMTAFVGFDYNDREFYGFAPNGGMIKRFAKEFDLTAGSSVFGYSNQGNELLPELIIGAGEIPSGQTILASIGGDRVSFYKSASVNLSSLKYPYSKISFYENNQSVNTALVMPVSSIYSKNKVNYSNNPLTALPSDPGLIIKWPKRNWRGRDYELFQWTDFPHILFTDTASYAYQDKMYKRIAFFVEKDGYKGKLWGDDVIGDKHGYNAHDYQAKDLARFFETARTTGFQLNSEELLLKQILINGGILIDEGNGAVSEGTGAILSISQETPLKIRTQLLAHEGWHGIFFEDEEFRNTVASIYYTCDQTSLDCMKAYFRLAPGLGYDQNDDFLMKTEFMSYLLQFDLESVQKRWIYYLNRPYMTEKYPELSQYLNQTQAEGLYSANQMMGEYVNDRWGLAPGRIWNVTTLTQEDK